MKEAAAAAEPAKETPAKKSWADEADEDGPPPGFDEIVKAVAATKVCVCVYGMCVCVCVYTRWYWV